METYNKQLIWLPLVVAMVKGLGAKRNGLWYVLGSARLHYSGLELQWMDKTWHMPTVMQIRFVFLVEGE